MAPGGVMIIPVGAGRHQQLTKITRTERAYEAETLEAVTFVPLLTGSH
jgi:protein-L-isoaspartate(D-aspartate) O-methyltransferase